MGYIVHKKLVWGKLAAVLDQQCMPRATFLLSTTPLWISLSWFIMKPSSLLSICQRPNLDSASKGANLSFSQTVWPLAPLTHERLGIPWALVFPSWSWAVRAGVASCPGSTSRVCPATAALHSPLRRSLEGKKKERKWYHTAAAASCYMTTQPPVFQHSTTGPQWNWGAERITWSLRRLPILSVKQLFQTYKLETSPGTRGGHTNHHTDRGTDPLLCFLKACHRFIDQTLFYL